MNGFGITLFQDNGMTIIRHKSTTFFLIVQEMIPKKRPTDAFLVFRTPACGVWGHRDAAVPE